MGKSEWKDLKEGGFRFKARPETSGQSLSSPPPQLDSGSSASNQFSLRPAASRKRVRAVSEIHWRLLQARVSG